MNSIPSKSLILVDECDEVFKFDNVNKDDKDKIIDDSTSLDIVNNTIKRSSVLNTLDGYIGFKGCILIFTTNYYNRIDKAILRPGRIDEKFELNECTQEQAVRILNKFSDFHFSKLENEKTDKEIKYFPTSSELINRIILPNSDNKEKIIEELIKYDIKIHNENNKN
jgi:ATP-dependent 26S proteasome regulatory subunit